MAWVEIGFFYSFVRLPVYMMLKDFEEGHLLALKCDSRNLFAEFTFLSETGTIYRVIAFNTASTPIGIVFEGTIFTAGFTTLNNVPSLGEVENIKSSPQGFVVEGDFGVISVVADSVEVAPNAAA